MTGEFDGLDASIDFSLQLFHLLREHNVALGTLQTIACTQSIVALHATRYEKLLSIYRLTLINRRQDWYRLKQLFDALLQTYLNPTAEDNKPENETAEKQSLEVKRRVASDDSHDNDEAEDTSESEGYSAREIDHHKDFRYLPHEDYSAVLALLERIANDPLFASVHADLQNLIDPNLFVGRSPQQVDEFLEIVSGVLDTHKELIGQESTDKVEV